MFEITLKKCQKIASEIHTSLSIDLTKYTHQLVSGAVKLNGRSLLIFYMCVSCVEVRFLKTLKFQ